MQENDGNQPKEQNSQVSGANAMDEDCKWIVTLENLICPLCIHDGRSSRVPKVQDIRKVYLISQAKGRRLKIACQYGMSFLCLKNRSHKDSGFILVKFFSSDPAGVPGHLRSAAAPVYFTHGKGVK